MTILHITNWYPSKPTSDSAPWIKAQIDALPEEVINIVYHVEIIKGRFGIRSGKNSDNSYYLILYFPFEIWTLIEWLSFWMVLWVFFKERKKNFDLVNFHIAYPNLVFVKFVKKWIKKPLIISEHWSAYHFSFNVSSGKRLNKIKRIFHYQIPVITVSEALIRDIRKFSCADFPAYILPNVVDTTTFNYGDGREHNAGFLMVSQWKWPKDPFTVLKAWKEFSRKFPEMILRIGGYGPQWKDMINRVRLDSLSNVKFLGKLTPTEIAEEMKRAKAFLHCSEYETFSVVSAEALCCGTPVIASNVGGIQEIIDETNGILVKDNTHKSWMTAICEGMKKHYERKVLSIHSSVRFGENKIGNMYEQILRMII